MPSISAGERETLRHTGRERERSCEEASHIVKERYPSLRSTPSPPSRPFSASHPLGHTHVLSDLQGAQSPPEPLHLRQVGGWGKPQLSSRSMYIKIPQSYTLNKKQAFLSSLLSEQVNTGSLPGAEPDISFSQGWSGDF